MKESWWLHLIFGSHKHREIFLASWTTIGFSRFLPDRVTGSPENVIPIPAANRIQKHLDSSSVSSSIQWHRDLLLLLRWYNFEILGKKNGLLKHVRESSHLRESRRKVVSPKTRPMHTALRLRDTKFITLVGHISSLLQYPTEVQGVIVNFADHENVGFYFNQMCASGRRLFLWLKDLSLTCLIHISVAIKVLFRTNFIPLYKYVIYRI
jgi:hypothetical protein